MLVIITILIVLSKKYIVVIIGRQLHISLVELLLIIIINIIYVEVITVKMEFLTIIIFIM